MESLGAWVDGAVDGLELMGCELDSSDALGVG